MIGEHGNIGKVGGRCLNIAQVRSTTMTVALQTDRIGFDCGKCVAPLADAHKIGVMTPVDSSDSFFIKAIFHAGQLQ